MIFGGQIQIFGVSFGIGPKSFDLLFLDLIGAVFTNDIGNIDLNFLSTCIGHVYFDEVEIFLLIQLEVTNGTIEFVLHPFL